MKKRVTMNMTPVMGHNRPYPRSPRSKVNATKEDLSCIQAQGQNKFLPKRATYVLSILKLICGCSLVVLGALALYMKASYSRTASGVWGGIVVIISGVLGTFTAKMNGFRPYVFFFFISCVLAIITDVLVTIYAATGLARDSGYPGGFILDDYTGDLIPVSQVNIPAREKAMVVNLLLIVMGVFEILFTLPCFIICLREICQCYDEEYVLSKHREANAQPLQASNEWLMSWLGHQNQVFYSASSGIPYRKIHPYPIYNQSPPPYVMVQSDHSRQGSNRIHRHSPRDHQPPRDRSSSHGQARPRRTTSTPRSSDRKSAMIAHYTPLEVYAPPPTHYYYAPPPSYHSPGSNLSQRSLPALVPVHAPSSHSQMGVPTTHQPPPHTWFYGSAPEDYEAYLEGRPFSRRKRARDQEPYNPKMEAAGRHPRVRSSRVPPPNEPFSEEQMYRRVKKKKNKHLGPTDSDLDKTYTGLDRELAEEFIEQTMDPTLVLNRSANLQHSVMTAPSTASLAGGAPQGSTVSASNSQFNPRMSTFSANDSEEAW